MDRPILFSAPMVRSILAGAKTQTRRVVKGHERDTYTGPDGRWFRFTPHDAHEHIDGKGDSLPDRLVPCPFGAPGDRLWVRESIRPGENAVGLPIARYIADDAPVPWKGAELLWNDKRKAIPSIHMCRDESRITLEVTGVRVERLHEITDADARAEGIGDVYRTPGQEYAAAWTARDAFARLWREINGAESWDANPWVWVVSFARVRP